MGSCCSSSQSSSNSDTVRSPIPERQCYTIPDTNTCNITGLAMTEDGRVLMADCSNDNVKLLTPELTLCSSVSVPGVVDVAVFGDDEVVVGGECCLTFLDISNGQLNVKQECKLPDDIYGICKHKDKLIVTFPNSDPASVKLIDRSGKEYWSLPSSEQEQPLFESPWYIAKQEDGRSSNVIITDRANNTLTVVNPDTGDIITRQQAERKGPFDVTTDKDGNVYVCYWDSREVAILSKDLKEEKIFLSKKKGLGEKPQAIVYDPKNNQLIISYFYCNKIDCFKLS